MAQATTDLSAIRVSGAHIVLNVIDHVCTGASIGLNKRNVEC